MNNNFVPLVSGAAKPREDGFVSLTHGGLPTQTSAGGGVVKPDPTPACSKPTVTLQRNGDVVTGIRVQCSCGQVIELSCVY